MKKSGVSEEKDRQEKKIGENVLFRPESGEDLRDSEGYRIYTLSVIGQVEGHFVLPEGQKSTRYEQVLPLLVDLEQDTHIDGVLILLNTIGGDVEAGLAIAEMVASMQKPTASLVLGGGHSIGVPLAVAAKHSFIVPSATMTVHPVRVTGTVLGVPQTFRYFADMQERIVRFVTEHSAVSREKFTELLMRPDEMATDVGSVLEGGEAVRVGLIHEIGGLQDAIANLHCQIRERKRKTAENKPEKARGDL